MKGTRYLALLVLAGLPTVMGIRDSIYGRGPASTDRQTQADPNPRQGNRIPVAVELFTSEGCSSCPPADALLARLAKEQPVPGAEVIALGEHVDYWNRLGWKDVYSSAAFSARQGEYARNLRSESVYTPQMVVDGRVEFVGSDERRAREAITAAAQKPKLNVQLTRLDSSKGEGLDKISLRVHTESNRSKSTGKVAEVLLAITEDDLQSGVTRGENAGRRLRHVAVVRRLQVVGKVDGRPNEMFTVEPIVAIPKDWKRQNLHVVVLVQEIQSRRVLGAASIAVGSP